jgi:hypothetical protein
MTMCVGGWNLFVFTAVIAFTTALLGLGERATPVRPGRCPDSERHLVIREFQDRNHAVNARTLLRELRRVGIQLIGELGRIEVSDREGGDHGGR